MNGGRGFVLILKSKRASNPFYLLFEHTRYTLFEDRERSGQFEIELIFLCYLEDRDLLWVLAPFKINILTFNPHGGIEIKRKLK